MIKKTNKVGVYVRPWNVEYYTKLVSDSFPDSEVITICEFKNIGRIWTGMGVYKSNKSEIVDFGELNDIHFRCRFLRSLPITESFKLIEQTYAYLNAIFDQFDFDAFFGALVDNYTLDILSRICKKRNIPYVSLVGHFINGYSRFSIKGELVKISREVSAEEVESVLNLIDRDDYTPNFEFNKKKSYLGSYKYYYKERLKELVFEIKKVIDRDSLNYHYNTLMLKGIKKRNVISKDIINEFKLISDIDVNQNYVYLPLHYTPEATVDYWCEQFECARYEGSILEIIKHSSPDIVFLIKEHPAMYLKRNLEFYKSLKAFPNVILIHPYESSNELLRKVDNVYVYTGSVGFEAIIRGKRVFTKTENYYSSLSSNVYKRDFLCTEDLSIQIETVDKKQVVQALLEGLIPAKFINSRKIANSDSSILKEYIAQYVRDFHKEIG